MKTCRRCSIPYPLDQYERGSLVCRVCRRADAITRYHQKMQDPAFREHERERWRRSSRRYNRVSRYKDPTVGPDWYADTLAAQQGLCAICQITPSPDVLNRTFSIDHDHVTGRVRGLLCHQCNLMLGNAKDNPATLAAGIAYLATHSLEGTTDT